MAREVFYINAIVCACTQHSDVRYYVCTNAGVSIYDLYDRLPKMAKEFLHDNLHLSTMISSEITLVPRVGVTVG